MPESEMSPEPGLESLLPRIVPGLAEQWKGSTPDEISQLERIAGRPLPPFYRWFLSRMGQSMGPLSYSTLDFSVRRILDCYAEGMVEPDPRFLLIAYESDEMMPLHLFYDFKAPARDDALVTKRDALGGELYDMFETLREKLAWDALFSYRVSDMPQQCGGLLEGDEADFLSHLDPVMSGLGFTQPVLTGSLCRLYERSDAAMLCDGVPRARVGNRVAFTLGGSNAETLRRILGAVSMESSLNVLVRKWEPDLR
ncbi:SMI1/KNR4 family protein [Pyxidicoccus xibeiensis]|uniref:SMI1/KNR4 family protein n=1 Tax=Pyxidicoccus xibeiensis TaxID=2906759 RepID=UPI0020A74DD0|nr:SMI1/KNR4 family protein [Pyxidicoccus xibeiensis]MCP3142111.1 SMI1/KNR4 family protein [Pyxidicoccus xibeiensis]